MDDQDSSQNMQEWSQRDVMLRNADNLVESAGMTRECKLQWADRKLRDAEIWAKHQRLGHLRHIDGNAMASDLRAMAQRIKAKLL
jgi:hypothetical protein